MSTHIKCIECRYAGQDVAASEYVRRRCKDCELDNRCSCHKKDCRCGEGCEYKSTDVLCPKQTLKWAAIQCTCSASDYYRALLNINTNGDMLNRIVWSGCPHGERGEGK